MKCKLNEIGQTYTKYINRIKVINEHHPYELKKSYFVIYCQYVHASGCRNRGGEIFYKLWASNINVSSKSPCTEKFTCDLKLQFRLVEHQQFLNEGKWCNNCMQKTIRPVNWAILRRVNNILCSFSARVIYCKLRIRGFDNLGDNDNTREWMLIFENIIQHIKELAPLEKWCSTMRTADMKRQKVNWWMLITEMSR